jgi:hypothetical protein
MTKLRMFARASALLTTLACLLLLAPAAGATSGTMTVSSNKTLTEHHNGTINITANNVTLNCAGFQVRQHSSVGNTCNTSNTGKCGIRVVSRSNVTIRGCKVNGYNANTSSMGIEIRNSSNISVISTHAYSNYEGMRVTDSTNVSFDTVAAYSNSTEGFDINTSTGISAVGLNATINAGDGVDEEGGSGSRYDASSFSDNGGNGFENDGGTDLWILRSHASFNNGHGISFDDVYGDGSTTWSGAWISECTVEENSTASPSLSDGIRMNNVSQVWLDYNVSWNNERWDGYLDDGATMTFVDNVFFTCSPQLKSGFPDQCFGP